MPILEFHNVNQPDGTDVTASNSSATGDDQLTVLSVTGMTARYWQGSGGTSAVQFLGGESTTSTAILGWNGLSATTVNKSMGFFMTALPGVSTQFAQLRAGSTNLANISIQPNGRLFVSAPGDSLSMTTVLAVNTWYRIDWVSVISTTAGVNRVVISPIASNTPLEDHNATGLNTGSTAITDFRWGKLASSGTLANYFIRDVRLNTGTTTPMGVYTGPTTNPPTVDPGDPITVVVNTPTTLTGTASSSANITSMVWASLFSPGSTPPTLSNPSSTPNSKNATLVSSFVPTLPGTYTFTLSATDAVGGQTSVNTTVTVTATPLGSASDADFGQAVLTVQGTGGTGPYTYTITPVPDDLNKPVPNVYIFTQPAVATNYTFTITDSTNTTTTRTVAVPAAGVAGSLTETVLYKNGQWV
jgi:hypothetical protein